MPALSLSKGWILDIGYSMLDSLAACADSVKEQPPAGSIRYHTGTTPVSLRYHVRVMVSDGGRDTTPGGVGGSNWELNIVN